MKVRVRLLDRNDLVDGYHFYENRSPGLGVEFLASLKADIGTLANLGGIHPIVHGSHRAVAKRYPYVIYYDVELHEVHVWAVAHFRRGPKWIRNRRKEL